MGLHDYFSATITSEDGMDTTAQQLLSAAMRLNRPPNKCVFFDESPLGVTAAHNCTMKAVALKGAALHTVIAVVLRQCCGGCSGSLLPAYHCSVGDAKLLSLVASLLDGGGRHASIRLDAAQRALLARFALIKSIRTQLAFTVQYAPRRRLVQGVGAEGRRPDVLQPQRADHLQHPPPVRGRRRGIHEPAARGGPAQPAAQAAQHHRNAVRGAGGAAAAAARRCAGSVPLRRCMQR